MAEYISAPKKNGLLVISCYFTPFLTFCLCPNWFQVLRFIPFAASLPRVFFRNIGHVDMCFEAYGLRIQTPPDFRRIDGPNPIPNRIISFLRHIWILRDDQPHLFQTNWKNCASATTWEPRRALV